MTEYDFNNSFKTAVIVGGGFAGLRAMRVLSEKSSLNLILIDQKNHHTFQPLLYQVATACLNPSDITSTLRAQFSNRSN